MSERAVDGSGLAGAVGQDGANGHARRPTVPPLRAADFAEQHAAPVAGVGRRGEVYGMTERADATTATGRTTPAPDPSPHRPEPNLLPTIGPLALALGCAWDALFYGRALGLQWPLFAAALVGLLIAARRDRSTLLLALPLLFFASMVAVRANATLTTLNVLATLGLLGLLAHGARLDRLPLLGY